MKQKWFIVGAVGDPIEVPDIDALHATLDLLEKNPPTMATKVRLRYNWIRCCLTTFTFTASPLDPADSASSCTAPRSRDYAY